MMVDYQKWLDRIDNLIQVQRSRCLDLVSANFTRRELIELKMMIEVLMESRLIKNDEPSDDCISRKAVIGYVQEHICEIITESGVDKNEHTNRMLRNIIGGIKVMPSYYEMRGDSE